MAAAPLIANAVIGIGRLITGRPGLLWLMRCASESGSFSFPRLLRPREPPSPPLNLPRLIMRRLSREVAEMFLSLPKKRPLVIFAVVIAWAAAADEYGENAAVCRGMVPSAFRKIVSNSSFVSLTDGEATPFSSLPVESSCAAWVLTTAPMKRSPWMP